MEDRKNVLILCTRNSCRSQMAEGILRKYAGDRFQIYSAGLEPESIHPLVERVMWETGIDTSEQRSKDVKEYLGKLAAHYLIVVCEHAEKNCPRLFPGAGERLYWPFDDPSTASGTYLERLAKFREIRDQIDARFRAWLRELGIVEAHDWRLSRLHD